MVWANWITAREAKSNSKGRFHCSLVMRAWGECSWADQIRVVFFVALGSPKSHRIPWVHRCINCLHEVLAVNGCDGSIIFEWGNSSLFNWQLRRSWGQGGPTRRWLPCLRAHNSLLFEQDKALKLLPEESYCTTLYYCTIPCRKRGHESHNRSQTTVFIISSASCSQEEATEKSFNWSYPGHMPWTIRTYPYNFFRLISFQALWLGCAGFNAKNYYKDWFYRKLISNYRWTHWVRRGVGIQVKAFGNTSRILWSDWTYSGDACLARCFGSKYSFWGANLAPNAWDVFCIWLCIVS